MQQLTFHHLPELTTQGVRLRCLRAEDAEAIFQYAADEDVAQYVTWEAHRTLEDSKDFVNSVIDGYSKGDTFVWGVTLQNSDVVIGTCALHHWSPQDEFAELGYAIGQPYWGQGLATKAARLVIGFGFHQLNLNRIYAVCHINQSRSKRVLEKVGMKEEGILRDYYKVKGDFWTIYMFSILRRELMDSTMIE